MAIYYWDYGTECTSSATGGDYATCTVSTTASTGDYYYYAPAPREIVVEHPEHWTDQQHAEYVKLVNDDTKTGWRVKMLMQGGDIRICDPNIEIRKMKDFVPLLRFSANAEDRAKIDSFFAKNGSS